MEDEPKDTQSFMVFSMGKELYAISICYIREITHYLSITPIVDGESYFLGIIRLRDKVVPIIDLRKIFKKEKIIYDEFTSLLLLNIQEHTVGIIVDNVIDILHLHSQDIKKYPSFPNSIQNEYIQGVSDYKNETLILIDLEKLLAKDLSKFEAVQVRNENKF